MVPPPSLTAGWLLLPGGSSTPPAPSRHRGEARPTRHQQTSPLRLITPRPIDYQRSRRRSCRLESRSPATPPCADIIEALMAKPWPHQPVRLLETYWLTPVLKVKLFHRFHR